MARKDHTQVADKKARAATSWATKGKGQLDAAVSVLDVGIASDEEEVVAVTNWANAEIAHIQEVQAARTNALVERIESARLQREKTANLAASLGAFVA